ncbi:Phosphate-selective porin O and P [compost metagenome]
MHPHKLAVGALVALSALQSPALALEAPKVSALLTGWYAFDRNAPDAFTLRRVNLYFSGDVTPELSYAVMINPAKTPALPSVGLSPGEPVPGVTVSNSGDTKILQDAVMTAKLGGGWKASMGQFRPPVSAEALNPAPRLPLAKRALFLEGNSFGFYRDLGLQVSGPLLPGLSTTVGVFNGHGSNQVETNHQKDVAGRLDYAPFSALKLGASYLRGARGASATLTERLGANAATELGPLQLSGEVLGGSDGPVQRLGWYGQGLWTFTPTVNAVLRYEEWDADQAQAGKQQNTTLGVNWALSGASKVAVNLIHEEISGSAPRSNDLGLVLWQLML